MITGQARKFNECMTVATFMARAEQKMAELKATPDTLSLVKLSNGYSLTSNEKPYVIVSSNGGWLSTTCKGETNL